MSTFRAKKKGKSGHGFHEVDIGLDKRVDIVVQNNMNKINNIQKSGHLVGQHFGHDVQKLMTMDRRTSVYKRYLSPSHDLFVLF